MHDGRPELPPVVVTLAIRDSDRFEGFPKTGPGKSRKFWLQETVSI